MSLHDNRGLTMERYSAERCDLRKVCHECGEWRRECSCDPQCEQQDKPLWPDMAESDYDA